MKKPGSKNSNRIENSTIAITATLAESGLLRSLVEDLANKRYDNGYSLEKVQPGFQAIETSSIEAHVSVDLNFFSEKEDFKIPFVTSFVFTCTKGKWLNYNFTWVNSLS
jgi:hypothetical protein